MLIDWAWLDGQMPLGEHPHTDFLDIVKGWLMNQQVLVDKVNMQGVWIWTWVVQTNLALVRLLLTLIGPVIV